MANNDNIKTREANESKETKETKASPAGESAAKKAKDERVEVYIERGRENDDPNFFVSVNGVNYLLPRGKTSLVPPHIKAEIDRARAAQEKLDDNKEKMLEASK